MEGKKSFDVKSIMDVLYDEGSSRTDSRFVYAEDGKQILQEDEVIHLDKKDRDYSSFWRH